jgi:hypothetical protein
MQIAANILLVILAFVTVLTTLAFRDTKRVHGPDIMGPAFFFVVSLGARWIIAAIALGLLVAAGVFYGLASVSAVQVIAVYAIFFAVDCAAASAVLVFAPEHSATSRAARRVATIFGYGLPPVLIVVFWLLQATGPIPGFTKFALTLSFIISVICIPYFMHLVKLNDEARDRANAEWYARQQQRAADGTAQVNAMPADVPLENLIPYLIEDWPNEVRSLVFERLSARKGTEDELIGMLSDERRRLAFNYLAQVYGPPSVRVAPAVLGACMEIAHQWQARVPRISNEDAERLAVDCGRCIEMAYHYKDAPVDFHPAINAWEKILAASPQINSVTLASGSVHVWRHNNPTTVSVGADPRVRP